MNGEGATSIEDIVRREHRRTAGEGEPHPAGAGRRDAAAGCGLDPRNRRPGRDHEPADRTHRGDRRRRLPRRAPGPTGGHRRRHGDRGRQSLGRPRTSRPPSPARRATCSLPRAYAAPSRFEFEEPAAWREDEAPPRQPTPPGASPTELERRRRPRERRPVDIIEAATSDPRPGAGHRHTEKAAERIERRLRLRVTAEDVDNTAQHLWSRSLEDEHDRRVADRQTVTGGALPTIRGHVTRDLDRELDPRAWRSGAEPPTTPRRTDRRPDAGRGGVGGHTAQHHPGQQGLLRQ